MRPILTIHGDQDQLVPYDEAVRLHAALATAAVTNRRSSRRFEVFLGSAGLGLNP